MKVGRRIVFLGMLTAFCVVLSYVESLIPFYFGLPGMKLGLANLGIVLTLYLFSEKEALLINILRILIVGFLFTNLTSVLYSISGAIFSFLMMIFMLKCKKFGIVGVSMGGSVFHIVGQCLMAFLIVKSVVVFLFLPLLAIGAVVTGFLIGMGASIVYRRLSPIVNEENRKN